MSDHGRHFSSYEGHKERRSGKIRGAFSRMHRALDGWMLARAPASPAQGLHHNGPRYFIFSYFCTMCGGWRHARGREHCRGEPGSSLSGGYAPDSAKAEGSSIVDESGEG